MIQRLVLVCVLSVRTSAFDWDKIDKLACKELQKGEDKKVAAVHVCKEVTQSIPFLQKQCETLVYQAMAALNKKCTDILPTAMTTTTTTEASAFSVLGDQLMSAFHGKFDDIEVDKIASAAMDVVPTHVKEAAAKAGLPIWTPEEMMCKGMMDAAMENRTERAVCHMLPNLGDEAMKACSRAVAFVWGQEAASMKCPDAPKPWWPFAILHGVADKLICFEFKSGDLRNKEQEITDQVCNTISKGKAEHWSCEMAVKQFFKGYQTRCAETNDKDLLTVPKGSDFLV